MNKPTHLLIGAAAHHFLTAQWGDLDLPLPSFLWGNIAPDFSPGLITRPHTARYRLAEVQGRIRRLLEESGRGLFAGGDRPAFELGILCHYYADFFCHVHNDKFQGSLRDHILYERRLCAYARARRGQLMRIDYLSGAPRSPGGDVLEELEESRRFVLRQQQNFGLELYGAIRACCTILMAAIGQEKERVYENRLFYGHISAAGERCDGHTQSA